MPGSDAAPLWRQPIRAPSGGSRSAQPVRRRRARLLASILAVAAPLCLHPSGPLAPCFGPAAPSASNGHRMAIRRRASGFSYGKPKGSAKGFGDGAEEPPAEKKPPAEGKGEIVKDQREGKSKALSRSKLSDLRDKTLALRQKREAELDEYEEGRAMIAKYGPKVAVMPQKVAERAAKRGMVIGGSFYATMLAVFGAGILIYKTQDIIIPPTLMAFITLALLGLAIAGSSYGMMSASWDEDREGSVLGTEEFGNNVKAIGEGFRRMSMQDEYEKAISLRNERKKLLAAKQEKKRELLNE
mmetsp:Transcript_104092/g.303909  ORF Transcript_104092/g.303909 Transcript_104092/m.303909 type:complete len:299 (+) Transcript_104092:149-1045(+)